MPPVFPGPRRGVCLVAAAVLLVSAGACSDADRDASSRSSSSSASSSASTSVPVAAGRAERDWDGIAEPVWEPEAYAGGEVRTALGDIAALGARTVTIVPTWYVQDTTTSLPAPDPEQTPSDDSVRAAIDEAHRLGMEVLLKPHVDLPDDEDRADIVPADPGAWFTGYRTMIVDYARLAQETGVERFAVGTELAGTLGATEEWTTTIAEVRGAFGGQLTYAANYDSYRDVPFWDRLDVIGVDAYFELADEPTTDVDRLVAAWGPILDELGRFAASLDRPLAFTEAGYVSQRGSTTEPWNWELAGHGRPAARSDAEQEAGYRALLRAVADRPWFAGVQWWMWDDLADAGEDQRLDYTPHGKPAEAVLRRVWRDGGAP